MRNLVLRPTLAVIALVALAPAASAQDITEIFNGREVVAGEVLIRLQDGQTATARIAADQDVRSTKRLGRGDVVPVRSRAKSVAQLVQEWRADPSVRWAEPTP